MRDQTHYKYIVDLNDDQIHYAEAMVAASRQYNRSQGFNGNGDKKFIGYLGEIVFCDIMGIDRPEVSHVDDQGLDFSIEGKVIDIKTMYITKPSTYRYVNDLNDYQFRRSALKTDVYVFANYVKTTQQIEFTGWIKKWDISKEWFRRKGDVLQRPGWNFVVSADMYEVPNYALNDFNPHVFPTDMQMFIT